MVVQKSAQTRVALDNDMLQGKSLQFALKKM